MGDVFELGFDRNLNKPIDNQSTPTVYGSFDDVIDPGQINGPLTANSIILPRGENIRSGQTAFNTGTGFFLGDVSGTVKLSIGDGTVANSVTWNGSTLALPALAASSGTIGGFNIGADYIRDVANSMGLASTVTGGDDVRFWAGDTFANRAIAPFRVTEAGAVTGSSITITGGSVSTSTLSGTIGLTNLNVANRGWSQTSAFSVTDADTVAWGAGTFTAADGTAYAINAGNTGNMVAKTFIYLDIAVSTTAYQTTTTSTTAVGAGKVLIAIAQNNTQEATFTVLQGQGAQNIDASQIVALSITANEIAASTITSGKMSVSQLSAIAADLGAITAGTIVLPSGGFVRSGQTAYNTGTGWYIGNDSGTTKLSIGDGGVAQYVTWDGANMVINGSQLNQQSIFGNGTTTLTVAGTTTLTADTMYSTVSIPTTKTLSCGSAGKSYRLFVKTTLTVTGTLNLPNPLNSNNSTVAVTGGSIIGRMRHTHVGGVGSGGAGPHTGTAGPNGAAGESQSTYAFLLQTGAGQVGAAGGAGGSDGGANGGGAGGSAGAISAAGDAPDNSATNIIPAYLLYDTGFTTATPLWIGSATGTSGSGGGGGGGAALNGTGGNGGQSGASGYTNGILWVAARTIVNNGEIACVGGTGGNGGNGVNASGTGAAGGGGGGAAGSGGGGGTIILIYSNYSGSGTKNVSGGAPGSIGTGGTGINGGNNGSDGSAGNTGNAGQVLTFVV